ncbi:MAG: efflux RND transporter periplasmic adaptor subunit, partial [Dehalococcoidia bacterium]|nr:efflux RND transporter periplasmic adaptor subunit [Dehalococcoidia bacterium]
WWYLSLPPTPAAAGNITASGFIEVRTVSVASEIGGRITFIGADEGDPVQAGMTLVRVDDTLLKAQLKQAEASVAVAQANLQQATAARDGAKRVLDNAIDMQKNPQELEAKIIAAEGELEIAENNLKFYDLRQWSWDRRLAEIRRDVAKRNLDNLLAIKANPQQLNAEVDRAKTALDTAEAGLSLAKAQIEQAQSALDTLKVQLAKTSTAAPISGTVIARYHQVGEVVAAGTPVLTIGDLTEVTLTVYIPELHLGLVKLGQTARVSVDSYPGETFTGTVTYIAPQAQFTPKNIQIKEERTRTVYAVKIKLPNPGQKLKAGMPADAVIITE